ncbi:MAG: AMP-dependent synthetase/ligase [Acidimicrobiia bacterium]
METTIPHLLFETAARLGQKPAYHVRGPASWEPTAWIAYAAEVRRVAAALAGSEVEPGTPVCILGSSRPAWTATATGAMTAGAVPAGIYTTSSPDECRYILDHAQAPVLVVEHLAHWDKIAPLRDQLPALRQVVTMPGAPAADDPLVCTWEEFLARGDGVDAAVVDERLAGLRAEGPGAFIYTSGTTGRPKAVVLTHDNLAWTTSRLAPVLGMTSDDRVLSYLPLAHIAEQMMTVYGPAVTGSSVYYATSLDELRDNLVEVRPTVFFGVPRVWEKFAAGVAAKLGEATGAKAKLASAATDVGRAVVALRNQNKKVPFTLELRYKAFDRLVYHKVKAALGLDQARMCAGGAAPLTMDLLEFLAGFGIVVHEIYGQSEDTGPTSFNTPGRTRFGTVGPPLDGVEVKIAGDGEILVRGGNVFAGYHRDPEATAETLQDGWLHSGDLGEFDADGYLTITGRKKDIIITAGGKNVAPKLIEAGVKAHRFVSEAVLVGDRRPYCTALVTLDAVQAAGVDAAAVRAEIQRVVDEVNATVSPVAQIKRFTVVGRELSVAEGELTPTLKVRRAVVADHFAAEIEGMYAAQ